MPLNNDILHDFKNIAQMLRYVKDELHKPKPSVLNMQRFMQRLEEKHNQLYADVEALKKIADAQEAQKKA